MMMEMSRESPQAASGDSLQGLPKDWSSYMGNGMGNGDMAVDLNSIHAANATNAAFHADVAAKHAASLAQWVQYLWGQIAQLQTKVVELEDWKMRTLDDMNKLRFEHKLLRKSVASDDDDVPGLPGKTKSLPLLLADHVADDAPLGFGLAGFQLERKKGRKGSEASTPASSSSMRPPPGLPPGPAPGPPDLALDGKEKTSRVRFAEQAPTPTNASASPTNEDDDFNMAPRSISTMSMASHVTDFGEDGPLEGVRVEQGLVDGVPAEIAEWRIGHLSTKLRGCMGRALVSSAFSMWGLEDLRLMVFPDGKEVAKGPRSRRQKELYAKKVTEGPLDGCLKLKVPDCPSPHILEYYLSIGSIRKGPFKHNFAESTVNGCLDFGEDWLQQVNPDQSLLVTVEILKKGAAEGAAAAAK